MAFYKGVFILGPAVKVLSEYDFDDGLELDGGLDFKHFIEVDVSTIIEFDRRDSNIIPTVNLNPRQRYHRVYEVNDFLQSLVLGRLW